MPFEATVPKPESETSLALVVVHVRAAVAPSAIVCVAGTSVQVGAGAGIQETVTIWVHDEPASEVADSVKIVVDWMLETVMLPVLPETD